MTSDLDKVLKNAVGRQMKTLTNKFQDTLRTGISDKIKGPMADTSDSMSGLDSIAQEILSRLDLGNDIMTSPGQAPGYLLSCRTGSGIQFIFLDSGFRRNDDSRHAKHCRTAEPAGN